MVATSVYIIRTTMAHYWSPSTKEWGVTLVRGRYRILARFQGEGARTTNSDMPGVALMNFWKGAVESNPFEFVVPAKLPQIDQPGDVGAG
jgi:hypothetical protein